MLKGSGILRIQVVDVFRNQEYFKKTDRWTASRENIWSTPACSDIEMRWFVCKVATKVTHSLEEINRLDIYINEATNFMYLFAKFRNLSEKCLWLEVYMC